MAARSARRLVPGTWREHNGGESVWSYDLDDGTVVVERGRRWWHGAQALGSSRRATLEAMALEALERAWHRASAGGESRESGKTCMTRVRVGVHVRDRCVWHEDLGPLRRAVPHERTPEQQADDVAWLVAFIEPFRDAPLTLHISIVGS